MPALLIRPHSQLARSFTRPTRPLACLATSPTISHRQAIRATAAGTSYLPPPGSKNPLKSRAVQSPSRSAATGCGKDYGNCETKISRSPVTSRISLHEQAKVVFALTALYNFVRLHNNDGKDDNWTDDEQETMLDRCQEGGHGVGALEMKGFGEEITEHEWSNYNMYLGSHRQYKNALLLLL